MDLTGKSVLITGGARRIGRCIALRLAAAGADIALHYNRSESDARRTANEIAEIGRSAVLIQADLADASSPQRLVAEAVARLRRLDVLVNNASIFEPMNLSALNLRDWERTLRVNLTAPAMLARAAWAEFQRLGGGKIVNLCDVAADRPHAGYVAYSVSKAALVALTKSLAREMAPTVQVNGISPGAAEFPENYTPQQRDRIIQRVPLARSGSPDDIAAAVRFLLEQGDYITGQVINVDGGLSIR